MTLRYVKGIAALSAASALTLGAGSIARAAEAPGGSPIQTAPVPPGTAAADAARVTPLDTCISCTRAGAGPGAASAHATALRLLGHDVSTGRALEGTGRDHGALVAVPANPLLSLGLLDWQEQTNAGDHTSSAHSRAAALDLALAPSGTQTGGAVTVAVLQATSDAGYRGITSQGSGSNDGVVADAGHGALVVVLLHSDASSGNRGSAYVLGINGTQVLSSDQTGSTGIPITIPGIADLALLQASAGGGGNTAGAAVGTVNGLLGQSGQQAGVLTASSAGIVESESPNAATAPATGTAAAGTGGLTTPKTGAALGAGGLLLLLGGGGLAAAALRRRTR